MEEYAPLRLIREAIARAGWLSFERFMALALYAPAAGYYARADRQFGSSPAQGSDFITAPELSPLFGRALARQVEQALEACEADELFEFGAGSGALAQQLLDALGDRVRRYTIVDVSGTLRARQHERLGRFGDRVRWIDELPGELHGVVVGNELLDSMPVALLRFDGRSWLERGVVEGQAGELEWSDRPTDLRPPVQAPCAGYVTELHRHASAFVTTLAERLRGAAFFIDYGFPESEYYHPQRSSGTLMCHRAHRADTDPLRDVGSKDISAHVNFSAVAHAAHEAGCEILGYTSQARFLMNCGLLDDLRGAGARALADAQKLLNEHEMGELFKAIGFARGCSFDAIGFAQGDRTHRL